MHPGLHAFVYASVHESDCFRLMHAFTCFYVYIHACVYVCPEHMRTCEISSAHSDQELTFRIKYTGPFVIEPCNIKRYRRIRLSRGLRSVSASAVKSLPS